MIPRRIDVPPDSPLLPIQPHVEWCARLIAYVHRIEDQVDGSTCECRCCRWARPELQG